MLTPSHAQPGSVMLTVVPRATKTPRCSRNLLRSQVPRQRPLRCGFATSTLRSCCSPPPSPASPTKTTPAELSWSLLPARRSRAFDAAHAPHQRLVQACAPGHPDESGFRGVEHPASQAGKLDSSGSSATPFFNPCSGTKCRPQKGVVPLSRVHFNAAEGGSLDRARHSISNLSTPASSRSWYSGSILSVVCCSIPKRPGRV